MGITTTIGTRTSLDESKDSDGTGDSDKLLREECQRLRTQCVSEFYRLMQSTRGGFAEQDVVDWSKGISKEELERAGILTYEEQIKAMQDNLNTYLPQT